MSSHECLIYLYKPVARAEGKQKDERLGRAAAMTVTVTERAFCRIGQPAKIVKNRQEQQPSKNKRCRRQTRYRIKRRNIGHDAPSHRNQNWNKPISAWANSKHKRDCKGLTDKKELLQKIRWIHLRHRGAVGRNPGTMGALQLSKQENATYCAQEEIK